VVAVLAAKPAAVMMLLAIQYICQGLAMVDFLEAAQVEVGIEAGVVAEP
jgi:hypothetical protein